MRYIVFVIAILFTMKATSQTVTHGYVLSKDSIIIGDAVDLIYSIESNAPTLIKKIDFSSMDSLESFAKTSEADTSEYFAEVDWNGDFLNSKSIDVNQNLFKRENNKFVYRDTFRINIWDVGVYQMRLPNLLFDTSSTLRKFDLQSPMILVNIPQDVVNTDTTTLIMPITNILKEEKSFMDRYGFIFVLIPLILLCFIIYKVIEIRKKKQIPIPDPVILPAHYIALNHLKDLKSKELWKQGMVKEHQSSLTHIIREYLENRFDIKALESTTDQILRALKSKNFSLNHESDLREILQIADMVKFAKAKPPVDINAAFLEKANEFVEQTKENISAEDEAEIFKAKENYDAIIKKINKKSLLPLFLPFNDFEFQHPWFLLLLLILPIMWYWKFRVKTNKDSSMIFPHVGSIEDIQSIKAIMVKYLPLLRYVGLAALILALARPRLVLKEEEVKAEGIDIMLVMDLSSSMLARDFNPDRLTVSKEMAKKFIDKRPYDRIGLVVFAGESFTQSPLTTDHRIVKEFLTSLESGMLEDGTAIGMGLASAVNRLKNSESKSKIVILLTDGVNNAGYIKPMTAAEIAKEIDVKTYTIGVGSMGEAISPISRRSDGRYVFGVSRVEIDEELLTEISTLTGGQYFRATNEIGLEQIYAEIDRLEKTEIEVSVFKRYSEEFRRFLVFGLFCLVLEWLLGQTILRTHP